LFYHVKKINHDRIDLIQDITDPVDIGRVGAPPSTASSTASSFRSSSESLSSYDDIPRMEPTRFPLGAEPETKEDRRVDMGFGTLAEEDDASAEVDADKLPEYGLTMFVAGLVVVDAPVAVLVLVLAEVGIV
jgi:hypothetical protein